MKLKVVYDTNVIVSALWKPGSIPASLVALAMGNQVRLFYSQPIFEEYQEVLLRPKFGFNPRTVKTFLQDLQKTAKRVTPRHTVSASPHEPDNRFLECAKTARADYLVSGNKRHFPFSSFEGTLIVSPAEFARFIAEEMYHKVRQ